MGREKAKDAIGGAFWLTVSTLIVKLLGLIYKVPLTRFLGEEGMGYFNSAYTVYGFFYLLCSAGVPKAVMMVLSDCTGDEESENKIVRCALYSFITLGLAVSALFIIFSAPLANIIGNSRARATMICVAPSIFFVSISGVMRGYLSARISFLQIAVSQVIEGVARLALGLVFALVATRMSMSLYMISAMTILGVTLGALFSMLYLSNACKIKIFGIKTGQNNILRDNINVLRSILRISVPITLSAAVMSLGGIVDLGMIIRVLVSRGYTESGAVALYGNYTTLTVPVFNLAIALVSPIPIAFLPLMRRAYVSANKKEFSEHLLMTFELCALICAPIMAGVAFFSDEILVILFPGTNTAVGAALLRLLSPAIFFSSILLVLNSALEATGNVNAPIISMLCGCIMKVIVGYALMSSSHGINGAPIGTVVCYGIACLISTCIFKRKFGEYAPVMRSNILPHICAIASVMTAKILYYRIVESSLPSILTLAIAVFVAAVIYLLLARLLGLLSSDRLRKMSKYTNLA